ncbi:MAG TPA: SGNH hydrolase domain-containing protein [Solirubrobacteraceae bacterium]|nr:SGNH hydrolase domain-containing protein [Solirubrobacteraceae bacterium]
MIAARRILRIFSLTLVALLVPSAGLAATPDRDPRPHGDRLDTQGSPLDLRSVSLGQRGTELVLRIATAGEWEPTQLSPLERRALCVKLYYGQLRTPRSQICAYDKGEGLTGLAYARLDPFGGTVENRLISASIYRYDKRSLRAVFEPSSVNLNQGRYSWQVESTWSCGSSPACSDRAPDRGPVPSQIKPLAEPPCFGAAARNPRYRCSNRDLRHAVMPPPSEAALTPNARCAIVSMRVPYTCQFGVRAAIANRTVALIGDSHAAHWRGALEVVAQARGWRGFSLTRSGCPLSTAVPLLETKRRRSCQQWRGAVRRWFTRHPKVRTVFVSQLASAGVRAPRGRSREQYQIQGYIRAWRMLPKTVRQIIVLRDTPFSTDNSPLCVERAMRERRRTDIACAVSRRKALRRDRAAIAARRDRSGRVHLVDLTHFMCSPRLCFPVVGGVLVHKDATHITSLFAGTLGPFLLKRVSRLLGG